MRMKSITHCSGPAILRDQRGFTGAEKALLMCFGLAVVSGVGFLVSQGGQKAAGDAAATLRSQSGGNGSMRLAGTLEAVSASPGEKGSQPMVAMNSLSRFSGDFRQAGNQATSPGIDFMPTGSIPAPVPVIAPNAAPVQANIAKAGEITPAQLHELLPNLSLAKATEYAPFLNQAMAEANINTKQREAMFLAQMAHESVGLTAFQEFASGKEYEGRCKGLGNCFPGDGVKFKGRGPLMLTGRTNYTNAGRDLHLDLVNHPELAEQPANAFRTSAWFWEHNHLNPVADTGNFTRVTQIINGGQNGAADRVLYWNRAKKFLGI